MCACFVDDLMYTCVVDKVAITRIYTKIFTNLTACTSIA